MLDASDCASLETIVDYGLETVDPERTATVPLRDLLYIFQTLGELVRFFHNDMHYPDLERIEKVSCCFIPDLVAETFDLLGGVSASEM